MRVLITGSSGFVGSSLLERLSAEPGTQVVATCRKPLRKSLRNTSVLEGYGLDAETDWSAALASVDAVVHLAARVHVMRETDADPFRAFHATNVLGSLRLARQAAAAGVKRFVFTSSIKVNGEMTRPGRPFTAADVPAPEDSYGHSKLEAERGLREVSSSTGMELVVVRPPLVYGPGVGANFRSMMRWIERGVPLPFGAIHNRRSLVAVDNLADLIITCLRHPAAAGQTFLAADGEDLSTTDLLRRTASALQRPARLLPVPQGLMKMAFAILGRADMGRRLCDSLQLDIARTRQLLGWSPPLSVDEALVKTAKWYLSEAHALGR